MSYRPLRVSSDSILNGGSINAREMQRLSLSTSDPLRREVGYSSIANASDRSRPTSCCAPNAGYSDRDPAAWVRVRTEDGNLRKRKRKPTHSFDKTFVASAFSFVCASMTGAPYIRTRRNVVPFLTHRLEKFWIYEDCFVARPEIGVFVACGGAEDLAAANIFSLRIETVTIILGMPAVQLHPVFTIGEAAPTLAQQSYSLDFV